MSLYAHEEVCRDCVFARWIPGEEFWNGKPRFARCGLAREEDIDPLRGKCESRQIETRGPEGGESGKGGAG
jgi:hypothetical protein